jgi:hypothetical protein
VNLINALLFADCNIIVHKSEEDLQKFIFILHICGEEFNMEISLTTIRVMVFRGKSQIRCMQLILLNSIIEQV